MPWTGSFPNKAASMPAGVEERSDLIDRFVRRIEDPRVGLEVVPEPVEHLQADISAGFATAGFESDRVVDDDVVAPGLNEDGRQVLMACEERLNAQKAAKEPGGESKRHAA